jgi:hypothetical protein
MYIYLIGVVAPRTSSQITLWLIEASPPSLQRTGVCTRVWECAQQYGSVHKGMGVCTKVWECAQRYGSVCKGMGVHIRVWECVKGCGSVHLSMQMLHEDIVKNVIYLQTKWYLCQIIKLAYMNYLNYQNEGVLLKSVIIDIYFTSNKITKTIHFQRWS